MSSNQQNSNDNVFLYNTQPNLASQFYLDATHYQNYQPSIPTTDTTTYQSFQPAYSQNHHQNLQSTNELPPFDISPEDLLTIDQQLLSTTLDLDSAVEQAKTSLENYPNLPLNTKLIQYAMAIAQVVLGIKIDGVMPDVSVKGNGDLVLTWKKVDGA